MEGFLNVEWVMALGSILFINLLLSGDNAVIIALASRELPAKQRTRAIVWGSMGAVICRIALTVIAAVLLETPYLQFLGGAALLWIAVSLLSKDQDGEACKEAGNLKEAIKIIIVADLIMSLDNVLALAAVAQTVPGSKYSLIIVGLATSVPMVMCGAQLLMKLMDRFPLIVYAGAGILGYAAAEMMLGDKAVGGFLAGYATLFEIALTVGVIGVGCWLRQRNQSTAVLEISQTVATTDMMQTQRD